MIGIGLALAAAISWGTGDFFGGAASRKINQFQVLLLTSVSSLSLMLLFTIFGQEQLPSINGILISVIAGISGAIGLAALYKGLSMGNSALVAPVAGVIGAIIPTLVGLFKDGLPGVLTLAGFALSMAGIWLVTRSGNAKNRIAAKGLGFGILAGFGFGGFLALIALIEGDLIFTPLVFTKITSLILAVILLRTRKLPLPNPKDSPMAILSGFLDTGGNILYLAATQFTRLDIAALLSSLYPAGTVLLSSLFLKEKISVQQWIGVITCIVAIILITIG